MQRLLVSAAHRSSGKTTVTLGILAALAARGVAVQPFKKGPDYIDPMWLALAAGRPAFNLDPHLMDDAALARCFARGVQGAALAVVEGNLGLYDGVALDGSNSNAALARKLALPVLLVIDARGMNRGIAPLLLGYQAFDRALHIGGVILNRVGSARHEAKLRAVVERYTELPVLGAVAEDARLSMTERHLGLMPCAEVDGAREWVERAGRVVASQVDLDRVRALAAAAAPLPATDDAAPAARARDGHPRPRAADVRIGIARDRAFGFYYEDDLVALREAGAELVPIDTLHDAHLPAVDGLFVGGGFPEACMDELQANAALRTQVRAAIEGGLPAYAECGGLMYFSRGITWQGRTARMVGAIPGDAVMHSRAVGRGYVQLEPTAARPWGPPGGAVLHGHEFHHSSLENLDPGTEFAYRMRRGHGVDGVHDGIVVHNLLASYAHLRTVAGAAWAPAFVDFVRAHRQRRRPAPVQAAAALGT
jgi:cobyrinic acid a,c-diamide synthase